MQIKQRARLRAARLALVLAAAAGVLAATAPAAGASTDAPGARAAANAASPFPPNTFRVKRNCAFIGHAVHNVEAAHCADLYVTNVSRTAIEIWAQNEVFCKWVAGPHNGQTTACSGIHERVGDGTPGRTFAPPQQICGVLFHHSACTSGTAEHRFLASFSTLGSTTAPTCSIWAESVHDSVVLPVAGHPTESSTVIATGHWTFHRAANHSCIEFPM
jgi:hypothetical protein